MNVEEARKLNDEYALTQQLDVEQIYSQIKHQAKMGFPSLTVDLKSIDSRFKERVFNNIEKTLTYNGFKVKRNVWHDQRDGDYGDSIIISWD